MYEAVAALGKEEVEMGERLSQVLLTDQNWINRCVAQVEPAEFGVEWAAGPGALTAGVLERWEQLLALEIDFSYCRRLREKFVDPPAVIRADILKYPLPKICSPYPLVGNLPYHLTGPLLVKILRNADKINSFQGLIQEEVAERVCAEAGESNYSGISVLFQLSGRVEKCFTVPAGAFSPVPGVDSAWLKFMVEERIENFEGLRKFARRCFQQPRKTLLNNLAAGADKEKWRRLLKEVGLDERCRPHQVKPKKFLEVFSRWEQGKSS